MVRINLPDGSLDALIKRKQSDMSLVSRLVQGVVPRNPAIALVMLVISTSVGSPPARRTSARCSQRTTARSWKSLCFQTVVLARCQELRNRIELPIRLIVTGICVPIDILAAGCGMQVDDSVDTMLCTLKVSICS